MTFSDLLGLSKVICIGALASRCMVSDRCCKRRFWSYNCTALQKFYYCYYYL